ncbi:MAG: indole-3-glycerol phosphate synthase TrpC [Betaproteobacteria bacterium]
MTVAPAADLLAAIVAATRRVVEVRASREPLSSVARRAEARPARAGRLRHALGRADRVNVIAECKRRSPSRGVLRTDYDPAAIATGYAQAGAAAISVLTEPTFFDGSLEHLASVRAAVDVPLLRKDFILSEYQLFEARAAGADAVLLIVAALVDRRAGQVGRPGDEHGPQLLRRLIVRAADLGLDPLVEVHDEEEAAIAVDAGAGIVGVNNRNLRTLAVDVAASERVVGRLPAGVIAVSESGLRSRADLERLGRLGFKAFLVGEQLMTAGDPAAELRALVSAC